MDKNTEKIIKAIYDDIKKNDLTLDWFWVKQEAESLLSGKTPNGTLGKVIYDHLKQAGKL
jgi:hypothetical protein